MNRDAQVIIIGGGLAGLTAAIHLAKHKISVTLIEKESYPKHKVCGEYISNEVLPYFDFLDVDIQEIQAVAISKFQISTQKGDVITSPLPLGGFGVSRYTLDHYLAKKAEQLGVQILQDEVQNVTFEDDCFQVETATLNLTANMVIGAYGKRTALDKTLDRGFSFQKSPWLAIKSHYTADVASDTVSLHNFKGGYCGISKVEDNKVNVCYLVNYDSFKLHKNITDFQHKVMSQNPLLKTFFENSEAIFSNPLSISQVNFSKKEQVSNHVLMIGDAAGLIHPLCGNGMAMAIRSAQLVSKLLVSYFYEDVSLTRAQLERHYQKQWKKEFQQRLFVGRALQSVLLHSSAQEIARFCAQTIPGIVPKIIRKTHGDPMLCS